MAARTYRNLFSFFFFSVAHLAFAGSPDLSPKTRDLIDRFFSTPEFFEPKLSPDGAHLAFLMEYNGKLALASLNCKTMQPAWTAADWKQRITDYYWLGPDTLVYEIGQDNYYMGLWGTTADLKQTRDLRYVDRVFQVIDPRPNDPAGMLVKEQFADRFYGSLFRYDIIHDKLHVEVDNPGRVLNWAIDSAGQPRLAYVAEKAGRFSHLYRTPKGDAWQPITLPEDAFALTFDKTGEVALIDFIGPNGRRMIQAFDFAQKKLIGSPISDSDHDLDPGTIRDPATGSIAGLVFEKEKPEFLWFRPDYKKLVSLVASAFPNATVYPEGMLADGQLLINTESDTSPPALYKFDPATNQVHPFMDSYPKVRGLALRPMQPVAFAARDGHKLHGYLTLPAGRTENQRAPLVCIAHGGPAVRDTWGYDSEVQFFAALGYAVLQVNYRGSTGYGREHELADLIAVGHDSVDDVADGMRWAVDQGFADSKRLVIYGGSYGGYIALGIATRYPDLPACVVGFAGVYDWEFMERGDFDGRFRDYYKWRTDYYPDLKQNAERYRAISPLHQASAVKAPVLLVHGRKDRRVDIAQSELMASALRKAGKSVEIVKDAEGVHGFPDEKLRRNYYERITAFILKYAPPDQLP